MPSSRAESRVSTASFRGPARGRAATRARALFGTLSLLALISGGTGCTRVPERSALGGLSALARPGASLGLSNSSVATAGSVVGTTAETLTLDQVQFKGSHNSYHQAPRMALAKSWRYTHLPLRKQLEQQGVRQIELDVRYSGGQVVVGHLPVVDGRSSCRTLKECLQQVKGWSDENPSHLPLFVFIEPKEHLSPSNLEGRLEVLDETISKVFPRNAILAPKDVVGHASSLKEAVRTQGWPSLDSARGKVVFVLFGRENHTRAYGYGRPRLEGRLMFATGNAQDPYAVFGSFDNPLSKKREIEAALAKHMLVRTRADADLHRDEDRRQAALTSGAHFIGSDFVDPKHNWLVLGERSPARCNPQSSTTCVSTALSETPNGVVAALGETSGVSSATPAKPTLSDRAVDLVATPADAIAAPAVAVP